MRKNRFLFSITATALITAILLSSCTAGRANSDASLQNSSASSAAGRLNSSLRTVASVPSGEISDKDEFLKGIWVDENGFVASFSENGRTAVFDEQTDEQTRKSVKITAQDKDTISISCEDKNYTAYHADSEKGAELCENLLTAASGDWSMCEYGYAQTVEIRKFTFLTSLGNDFSGDKITVGLEGVKLRNSLFESDGSETYARLDGDKLIFIFSYGDMVSSCTLIKKDSDEYNELTDAGSAINGVWVDPDDLNTTLTFFAGKSLTVTGNAFKEELGEKFDSLSGKAYVIAAVSGGADSVALLYVLYSLKDELCFSLAACHVNHNLRGEESDSDERFVRRMCRFLDIPLYTASIKVNDLRQKHDSLEECARRLRYEFFESISKDRLIATAHTASDNCETILINMVRGTALSGICGIPAKRDNIIRPLLYNTREDIELYCSENCLDYVTDSTNLSDDYTRNRIRHKVVPLLKEINPSLFGAISRLSQSVSDDDRYLDKIASELMEKARTADDKYDVGILRTADDCILRRIVTMIFKDNDIPPNMKAVESCVGIIRAGQGKINPCQFRFVQIRKKKLFVVTDREKFRRN